jgi:diguanylate cyclase (GGDEF)-like protein
VELFRNSGIRARIILSSLIVVLLTVLAFSYIHWMKVEIDLKGYLFLANAVLLITLIISYLVGTSILNPLLRIRRKLHLFSEKRTVTPVKDHGTDEVADISTETDLLFDSWNSELGKVLRKQKQHIDEKNLLSAAHTDLERQLHLVRSCLGVAQRLNTTFDFHANLKTILDEAVKAMNVQWASVLLINRDTLDMTVACVRGIEQSLLDDLTEDKYPSIKLKPHEGLAGQVIKAGLPMIANKGFKDPRFKVYSEFRVREEKIGSLLCAPVKGNDGTVFGVINFVNRISPPLFRNEDLPFAEDVAVLVSLVVERNRLFKSLFVDEATGMISHKVWKEYYAEEVSRAIRYAHPLSVAILEIDGYKEILESTNAEFALSISSEVGKLIRTAMRDCDSASRVQNRYYLLLVDTDPAGSLFFIGRIKEAIEKKAFSFGGKSDSIMLSAGIAGHPDAGPDARNLPELAQKALDKAKSAGSNRAVIYGAEPAAS